MSEIALGVAAIFVAAAILGLVIALLIVLLRPGSRTGKNAPQGAVRIEVGSGNKTAQLTAAIGEPEVRKAGSSATDSGEQTKLLSVKPVER